MWIVMEERVIGPLCNFFPYLIKYKKLPSSMRELFDYIYPMESPDESFSLIKSGFEYSVALVLFFSSFFALFFLLRREKRKAKKFAIVWGVLMFIFLIYYDLGLNQGDVLGGLVEYSLAGIVLCGIYFLAFWLPFMR